MNGIFREAGYISIQAEGTSTQFRKLEILELTGCMDSSKTAYRSYFVKSDPAACNVTAANAPGGPLAGARLFLRGRSLVAEGLPAGSSGSRSFPRMDGCWPQKTGKDPRP